MGILAVLSDGVGAPVGAQVAGVGRASDGVGAPVGAQVAGVGRASDGVGAPAGAQVAGGCRPGGAYLEVERGSLVVSGRSCDRSHGRPQSRP